MNPNIQKLVTIANKRKKRIIGLMSGTSLDGLDIALCSLEGTGTETRAELEYFETFSYADEVKEEIREVFAKKDIKLEKLCLLHPWIALLHARYIRECLSKWNIDRSEIDLIASHGQTIYHAPMFFHQHKKFGNATLQIGDGDHLAVATGIITISDFRQKHIAAGGEGAPLALYGDYLLFSKKGEERILLNIGGIANFTYLPADTNTNEIICTDTGPGNTLMDAYVRKQFRGKYFDEDAALAIRGKVIDALLTALKENDFFDQPFPKTTGPELFNMAFLEKAIQKAGLPLASDEDILATLNKFTADCIVDAIKKNGLNKPALHIYCSGGGLHNPLLMQQVKDQLPGCIFHSTAMLGIAPDAKEAVLFAALANELICGDPAVFGEGRIGMPPVSMGKISFPG